MPRRVLGISAFYHDSAAALLCDGEILAAAHEERFTRKRHDETFPLHAVRYVLEEAGIAADEVDAIAFYDKPFLKFERLLETYHAFAPKGLRSFWQAMPIWVQQKLFLKRALWQGLEEAAGRPLKRRPELLFPEHHLSHAASAFYPSPFDEAAILTVDGVGEWTTTSIAMGSGPSIKVLRELAFPHSLGLLYSAFTYFLGFKVNSGEYKLMGLAPYGASGSASVAAYKEKILAELVDIRDDGSLLLNLDYFDFPVGLRMCRDDKWEALFKRPRRESESPLTQADMDLALAAQEVTEEVMLRLARTARALTGCPNVVLAGGVALNCTANGKLLREKIFENMWIQPAAGDAGGALGAAYAAYHLGMDGPRPNRSQSDSMQGAYLGPRFSEDEIARVTRRHDAPFRRAESMQALCDEVAGLLAEGAVVGWFQGRMEWGPRSLGNRSILGDPRRADMQKKLNLKIKFREGFRPFAPAVLEEDCGLYFDLLGKSPYMLVVAPVREELRSPPPETSEGESLLDRLYHQRSAFPAVTHVDYSARVQTVDAATNPPFRLLLEACKRHTGMGMLVNTSFNVRGEPIVLNPEHAYRCFMRTDMDYLVMEDFLFDKRNQPPWIETEGDGLPEPD